MTTPRKYSLEDLDALSKQLKEKVAEQERIKSLKTSRRIGLADFVTSSFGLELPPFQVTWCNYLEDWVNYPNLMLMATRNSGKSQLGAVEYPTWLIVNNPDIRGLIISKSANQAQSSLRSASKNLADLGLKPSDPVKWTQTEIIVNRKMSWKDPTLSAAGLETDIVGRHVDFAILDDCIINDNSETEEQREKFREWYTAELGPILNPNARVIVLGTRWRPQDFYGEIIEKYSDEEPPKGLGKRKGFKVLKYPCYDVKDPEHTLLWPERLTYEYLEGKRLSDTEGGVFFQAQYLLDAGGMLGLRFKQEWIKTYDVLPKCRTLMACDLATGKGGDRFAICVAGLASDNKLYVIDYRVKDITFPDQVALVKKTWEEYPAVKIGIEDNNYQVALSQQLLKDTNLPIYPITAIGKKEERITMMTPAFENGHILFPAKEVGQLGDWYKQFLNEYLVFPKEGAHDDMLDALYMVWMMSNRARSSNYSSFKIHFEGGKANPITSLPTIIEGK